MRGETVAQPMGADFYRYAGFLEMLFDDARHAPGGDSLAAIVEKHRRFASAREIPLLAQFDYIVAQGFERRFAHRHDTLLRAFAQNADDAELKIDVGPIEADQLAHAHAGGIKKLEDGAVAHIQPALDLDA